MTLKDRRKALGFSLQGLAGAALMSKAYLHEIEGRDDVSGVGFGVVCRLAPALGMSLTRFASEYCREV